VACVAALVPRHGRPENLEDLRRRGRLLRETINAAAALLVSGILHMAGWLRWSTAMVSDDAMRVGLDHVTLSVTLFWGMTFSLMIAAAYLPATTLLREQAFRLHGREGRDSDPEKWLKEQGFKLSLGGQLPQIAVMLAPALASPAASLLGSLTDFVK